MSVRRVDVAASANLPIEADALIEQLAQLPRATGWVERRRYRRPSSTSPVLYGRHRGGAGKLRELMALSRSAPPSRTTDPNEVLNWVRNEGWELVNGSFVFVEQAHQSRNKMVTTGQGIAVMGETIGYYLFRRCEANRVWNQADEPPPS